MNQNAKQKKKLSKKQKKTILICSASAAILLAVAAAVLITIFVPKHSFEFDNGDIVDRNGDVYKMVVENYRPTKYRTDDMFAKLDHPIFGEISLFEVENTNGALLYCKEDGLLYRKSDYNLPSLLMFEASRIVLSTKSTNEMSVKDSTDPELIEKYISLISDEKNAVTDKLITETFIPEKTYYLSFYSNEYPSIMYTLSYCEKGDSEFYLIDRLTGSYFKCDDEFHKLLEGSDRTFADETTTSPEETKAPGVEV